MADDRRIVIELKNIADQTAAAKTNKIAEENSDNLQKTLKTLFHPIKTLEQETIGKNVLVNQAYQNAKQAIKQVGQYHIYKYFTLKENYEAEEDFSNMMNGIGKFSSFVGTVGAGATMGAQSGGGWGAVIGAVISGGAWITTEVLGAKERKLQEQITFSTNNYQSQFQQTRLGLTEGRGVTNQ